MAEARAARHSLGRSTLAMTAGTLLSRITGLARTWMLAFVFGNTVLNSAYQIANTMPNMIYDLVAGGIISAAFIPIFLRQEAEAGKAAADRFGSNLLNIVVIVLGLLSVLGIIFAPQVIASQTWTQSRDSQVVSQAVELFQLFAFQILCYGVSSVISCILNAKRVFFITSWAPALNNLVVIAAFAVSIPLFASGSYQAAMLVVGLGTTAGVVAQFAIQIPSLLRAGFRWRPVLDLRSKAFLAVLKTGVPTIIFVLGTFVVFSFRNAFALGVGPEGPSTISYAWVWFQLPYGLLAVSISKVLFTEMSDAAAQRQHSAFKGYVRSGLALTLFFIIPLSGLICALSAPIITLFNIGSFSASAVGTVAALLSVWICALPFYAMQFYLYRVFAAIRKFGLYCAIRSAFCLLQVALYALLCQRGLLGLLGVGVSDIVYYALTSAILFWVLRRRIGHFGFRYVCLSALKVLLATLCGMAAAFLLQHFLGFADGVAMALLEVILYGLVGLAICVLVMWLLRVGELGAFAHRIRGLLRR